MKTYDWGYHSSETQYVHVSRVEGERREDLFDVTLYDRDCTDATTGRNCEDQSLEDLKELLALANTGTKIERVEAMYAEACREYDENVVPGVSDDSVLEATRDTLEAVLAVLKGA